MIIPPITTGVICPPSSKSLSHRALICAALSGSGALVESCNPAADLKATLACLSALGFASVGTFTEGLSFLPDAPSTGDLFCGESGTSLRFFLPLAAAMGKSVRFYGSETLLNRPLSPILAALESHGCQWHLAEKYLTIEGQLTGGLFSIPGNISSQFISGLLLALPLLGEDSELVVEGPLHSAPYVDLTLSVMADFGVSVLRKENHFWIRGGQFYRPCHYVVESDYSAAAFFLVAAALGANISIQGLNFHSLQGDMAILDFLKQAGAVLTTPTPHLLCVSADRLQAFNADVSLCPDLVPILTVLMCFCQGTSHITGAAALRHKESDRLMAIAKELNHLGAKITEGADFLTIQGVDSLHGGACSPHNDHRIAMALAVASLACHGEIDLSSPHCVEKSYVDFWNMFSGKEC